MSEFILKEESFKFGILDRPPVPNDEECFLLYQTGAGKSCSFVIRPGIRYASAEIRHGRYNRIATISLGSKHMTQKQQVAMRDRDFYFNVAVQVSYTLQDVQEYFFAEQIDEEDIRQAIRNIIRKHDGEWEIQQSWDAQNDLETELAQRLRRYESLKFRIVEVQVCPDESASKILQSNRNRTVGIYITRNETDEKVAKNEQTKRVLDSENELKFKKIQDMAIMMKNFGSLGPVVEEYLKGNMDGANLYNYILKARTDELSILNTAVSNDLLPQEEVIEKINEILDDNKFFHDGKKRQLLGEKKSKTEDTRNEPEAGIGKDEYSLEDGDYI